MKKFACLFIALLWVLLPVKAEEKDSLIITQDNGRQTAIPLSDIEDIHFSLPGDEDREAGESGITQVVTTSVRAYRFPLSGVQSTRIFHAKGEVPLCPDDNHPHMIDLGLPSGTKWACCNVGADAPEGYGGYYAWGEVKTKDEYTWESYLYGYYDYEENVHRLDDIGSDIGGTQYDAAAKVWNENWRMPSVEQTTELVNHTVTGEWTTLNGVYGQKFTGPNGASIFLPIAGYNGTYGQAEEGHRGVYWTSSLYGSSPHNAYALEMYYWSQKNPDPERVCERCYGYSIRPVSR